MKTKGIDISTWQKPSQINYDQLAKEVDFVILRAGYTGHGTGVSLHKDDTFEKHHKAFHERGIPIGVYWYSYANTKTKGIAEANKCLEIIKGKTISYPVFIDTEDNYEITAYATDAAVNHGKEWNGFKVVEGRSVRKYKDEDAIAEKAVASGYKDIYRKSLIPMTEMQKLMGKAKFEDILGDLIYKPQGKPTLVPNSDKRPAINVAYANGDVETLELLYEDIPDTLSQLIRMSAILSLILNGSLLVFIMMNTRLMD